MPDLPIFKRWPDDLVVKTTPELIRAYERGFQGAYKDPQAEEEVYEQLLYKTFSDAASENNMVNDGAGKLSLAYEVVEKLNKHEYPGKAQRTGCCVSRSTVNAFSASYAYEVWNGIPDDVRQKVVGGDGTDLMDYWNDDDPVFQGLAERWPKVPYPDHQTFDHVIIYMERGHRGQGANCGTLARASSDKTGLVPRGKYDVPGYGEYDCSRYDDNMAARSGPRAPASLRKWSNEHHVRDVTGCREIEEARDALANNYGISVCSGYATSSRRPSVTDENGNVCAGPGKWRGSWAHAMAWLGCDDREIIHRLFGGPIFLVMNSWGSWNSGPRQIYNTNKFIPEGSFWINWRDARSMLRGGGAYVLSNVKGFPRRPLIVEFV